jgi:hypothetical protein
MEIDWGRKIGAPVEQRERRVQVKVKQRRGLGFVPVAQAVDPYFATAVPS